MITGELKSNIDKLWEAFWVGGITNPLTVIEQITFLMYSRRRCFPNQPSSHNCPSPK
jgi:hypothetical protein